MIEHRWSSLLLASVTGLALLAISNGCGADGAREAEETAESEAALASQGEQAAATEPATEQTDVGSSYEGLAALYEQMMREMPAAGRGEMHRMRQMAGQMRHLAGMMGDAGHMRGERMGMGRGHMQGMHRGAMGAGGPAGMVDWHERMAELHRQWADDQSAAGNPAVAEHLEQMAARHESLAEAFGGAAAETELDVGAGDGAGLYAAYCSACHGSDGQGVPGAFPPLAGSSSVVGPAERIAGIVLRGLHGPLEVAGETYYGVMPSFASRLDDEQAAALLSFVRSSWGNEASPVTPEQVAEVRSDTAGLGAFSADEVESGAS